jgi:quinol monooxygenase YgiN
MAAVALRQKARCAHTLPEVAMIIEYIRYALVTHTSAELIAAYQSAADALRASPECLGFDLTVCSEAPECLILRIKWTSIEDHLNGFRKGPHFPPFFAAVRPFFEEIAEMRHYTPTDVEWTQ